MRVRTCTQPWELHLTPECDNLGTKKIIDIWECYTAVRKSDLRWDTLKSSRLEAKIKSYPFIKIIALADKEPIRGPVKRSEQQTLRHHCYNHHLKKNHYNQLLIELDGLLLYEFCDNSVLITRKRDRKVNGGRCRSPEGPT